MSAAARKVHQPAKPAKPGKRFPVVIAQWRRNVREDIRVALDEYEGRPIIDIRTWFEDNGERRPTRTGLTLSVKHLPALAVALAKALKEAERLDLMKAVEAVR